MTDTDQYQLALAQKGDKAAFGSLATCQAPGLYSYLLRMLRGRREEAEDLSQETFLRAYRSIASFRGQSKLRTWLRRIASNLAINHIQRKRLPACSLDFGNDEQALGYEIPDQAFCPEVLLDEQHARHVVERALEQLPGSLRVVFVLKEFEGYTHEETARLLGLTAQNVRVRHHRAKQALTRLLAIPTVAGRIG